MSETNKQRATRGVAWLDSHLTSPPQREEVLIEDDPVRLSQVIASARQQQNR